MQLTVLLLLLRVLTVSTDSWTYPSHTKEKTFHWDSTYPWCAGKKQSPIDLRKQGEEDDGRDSYRQSTAQKTTTINFEGAYSNGPGGRISGGIASNNGHVIRYEMPKNVSATIRGGVLENRPFRLDHFHVHFGSEETRGSEHTIDGVAYPAEVHFVHYNTKYRDLESALMEENGLSVIGVFLKLGSVSNPELDELKFETLSSKGMKNSVGTLFLNNLLPTRRDYYTYEGSLTTPPCDENVRWIVMRHPIPITPSQLWALRRVNTGDSDDTSMADNYRPTQPLNGRKVDYHKESKDNKDGDMKWWVWLCIGLGGLVIILIPIIIIIATNCRTTKREELKTTHAITV